MITLFGWIDYRLFWTVSGYRGFATIKLCDDLIIQRFGIIFNELLIIFHVTLNLASKSQISIALSDATLQWFVDSGGVGVLYWLWEKRAVNIRLLNWKMIENRSFSICRTLFHSMYKVRDAVDMNHDISSEAVAANDSFFSLFPKKLKFNYVAIDRL